MSAAGPVIVAAFFGTPFVTLIHELGHATAALAQTDGPVSVSVGRSDTAVKVHVGRLQLAFSLLGAGGVCRAGGTTRGRALIRVLAGPAANALLAVILVALALQAGGTERLMLLTLGSISAMQLTALVPGYSRWNPQTRGRPSDGLQALALIQNLPLSAARGQGPRRSSKQIRESWLGLGLGALLALAGFGVVVVGLLGVLLQLVVSVAGAATPQAAAAGAAASGRAHEPTKTCTSCGAHVRLAARLCFCYHRFESATTQTAPPGGEFG